MYFSYEQEIVDVNFHINDLGCCKGTMRDAVERNLEGSKSHIKFCIFNQDVGEYEPFLELLKMNLLQKLTVNIMTYRIRSNTLRIEENGRITFTNNQHEVELYINRAVKGRETILGELRIRKNDDQMPREKVSRKIITLNEEEIKLKAERSYKEKINSRKEQEKRMEIKEKKPVIAYEQRSIVNNNEENTSASPNEEEPTIIDIIRNEEDKGFKKGNKPKGMKTRYQKRKGGEEVDREKLKGNAASIFLVHNMNKDKWWNDQQIKKEHWLTSGKKLIDYILSNEKNTWTQINRWKDKDPPKAMKIIKRTLMQIHQSARDKYTDKENLIVKFKGRLSIEALQFEIPIGNMKTIGGRGSGLPNPVVGIARV
jgi:hypothetical protein